MKPKDLSVEATDAAIEALSGESDRGAALLAGSLVENALGQFLERHCSTHISRKHLERLFGPTGPIGSFSQRILVAAAFGLITKDEFEQLELIRETRNHFAHHPLAASFNDMDMTQRARRLRFHTVVAVHAELQTQGTERMAYLLTCGWLLGYLQASSIGDES